MDTPATLQQAILWFAEYQHCHDALVAVRWPDGVVKCPTCGSTHVTYLANARVWKCYEKHPLAKFSLKVGTVFEDSPIPLQKWLPALWLLTNCKNGISSYELARALGVTQKTAWFMLSRLRLALQNAEGGKLGGVGKNVEIDETYIGGKARNMHQRRRADLKRGRRHLQLGTLGKVAVQGLLERHGRDGHSIVKLEVVPNTRRHALDANVRKHVQWGSDIHTDELRSYNELGDDYIHNVINHAEKYVDGEVHTNGLENFWSLLKRALRGTYVSVEPFHLFRYLDEQAYRFNNRKLTDAVRFALALKGIVNKRLTYTALTGSELQQTC